MTRIDEDRQKPKETGKFNGVVRPPRMDDLVQLKPILETWIKNRTTGEPIPEEVEEDLQFLRGGNGIGTALVQALEETARQKGFTEVVLNSGPRYENTGWGFYDKLPGFRRAGVAVQFYGEGGDAPVWHKIFV